MATHEGTPQQQQQLADNNGYPGHHHYYPSPPAPVPIASEALEQVEQQQQQYQYQQQQQQQQQYQNNDVLLDPHRHEYHQEYHQSVAAEEPEIRVGGDGEEVYGDNSFLRPVPASNPNNMVQQMSIPPAAFPSSQGTGQGTHYGGGGGVGGDGGYEPPLITQTPLSVLTSTMPSAPDGSNAYDSTNSSTSQLLQQHSVPPQQRPSVDYDLGSVDSTSFPPHVPDNRSVDEEDETKSHHHHRSKRKGQGQGGSNEYDNEDTRSIRSHRGGPRRKDHRESERDRDRSRREWEHSKTDRRRYQDFDDFDDRPRSRGSFNDDEEYYSRHRRPRGEGESDYYRRRGPPSEFGYSYRPHPGPPTYNNNYGYGYPPAMGMPVQPFQPYAPQPMNFSMNVSGASQPTQSLSEFLNNLKYQNPLLYSDWYQRFLAYKANPGQFPFPTLPGMPNTFSNAASVGPSRPPSQLGQASMPSEDSRLQDSTFKSLSETNEVVSSVPSRNTPLLFPSPHSFVCLSSLGLVFQKATTGTTMLVSTTRELLKGLPEQKELLSFPGPLIKDVTHKNTIIQFCQDKIKGLNRLELQADDENLILIWELLILLLRQNGSAIGSDIAELLLKTKASEDVESDESESETSDQENENVRKDESVVTPRAGIDQQKCEDIFCQKLLYGHRKEALEYAINNNLWGHALFFGAKMDEKLYGTVLARFANDTMPFNSPLQTLYHFLCGKQPPSVSSCSEEEFGDWKPHLAMLLSNMGSRPAFEANTIRALGASLAKRKLKFAAQFCYLMGESEFSEDSEIGALLGINSSRTNILEATQMTEIYEFARTLANPEFSLGTSFIESKFRYMRELLSCGLVQEANAYCEQLTKSLKKNRIHSEERKVAGEILLIAERIVRCDDSLGAADEPSWISELRNIANEIESETGSRRLSSASTSDRIDDATSASAPNTVPCTPSENERNLIEDMGKLQLAPAYPSVGTRNSFDDSAHNQLHQWNIQQPNPQPPSMTIPNFVPDQPPAYKPPEMSNFKPFTPFDSGHMNNNYLQQSNNIGLGPQSIGSESFPNPALSAAASKPEHQHPPFQQPQAQDQQRPQPPSKDKGKKKEAPKTSPKGGGLFSGIFSKILKTKNQMHLPDDKDPAIIWDPSTGTWKNMKGDEDEDSAPKGPPPRDSDFNPMSQGGGGINSTPFPQQSVPPPSFSHGPMSMVPPQPQLPGTDTSSFFHNNHQGPTPQLSNANQNLQSNIYTNMNGGGGMPPGATAPEGLNKFQRPKGLKLKNNYVDVFQNSAGAKQQTQTEAMPSFDTPKPSNFPNLFMPTMPMGVPEESGPSSFLSVGGAANGVVDS